jgi:mRNA interferase HigB
MELGAQGLSAWLGLLKAHGLADLGFAVFFLAGSDARYRDAQGPLEAWHAEVLRARWRSPHDVKAQFRSASIVGGDRVVFNIAGNKYRLVAAMDWERQILFVKFVGSHALYDKMDVRTV